MYITWTPSLSVSKQIANNLVTRNEKITQAELTVLHAYVRSQAMLEPIFL